MENQPSIARIALKWGLITGVALILFSTVLYTFDLTLNRINSVIYLILIGGLILVMLEYRKTNGGYMSYGDGISLGALSSAVAGLLSSLFSVFYTQIIDPGFQERITEKVRAQLEDQGLADDQIDQALEIGQKFQSPGIAFAVGIFTTILIGVLLSLIIAAVIRRNKTNPFE